MNPNQFNMSIRKPSLRPTRLTTIAAAFALGTAAVLAGCSSVPLDESKGAPVESRTPGAGGDAGAGGAGQSSVAPVTLDDGASDAQSLAQRTVYFDFDSYVVRDDGRPIVERFAKTLSADRGKRVQIEGHTDDRGGREYNLALGQKRADAVAKSLELLGVNKAQVEAVSYGKERPVAEGDDESARALNRRAVLNYR